MQPVGHGRSMSLKVAVFGWTEVAFKVGAFGRFVPRMYNNAFAVSERARANDWSSPGFVDG